MKIIAVDMDDVLVELLPIWIKELDENYGLSVKEENILDWKISKAFPELTDAQIVAPLYEEQFWKKVKPNKCSVEYLLKLKELGFKIYVVTASHYDSVSYKLKECLFKYYKYLNMEDIIICYNKSLINCDIIIDDYDENIKDSKAVRFLIDKPYNRHCPKNHYDFRVNNMSEIYDIISEAKYNEI